MKRNYLHLLNKQLQLATCIKTPARGQEMESETSTATTCKKDIQPYPTM